MRRALTFLLVGLDHLGGSSVMLLELSPMVIKSVVVKQSSVELTLPDICGNQADSGGLSS